MEVILSGHSAYNIISSLVSGFLGNRYQMFVVTYDGLSRKTLLTMGGHCHQSQRAALEDQKL